MLSRESLEEYRRLSVSERLKLVLKVSSAAERLLVQGPPDVVSRRFELLRRQNDDRNRRMLEGLARTRKQEAPTPESEQPQAKP